MIPAANVHAQLLSAQTHHVVCESVRRSGGRRLGREADARNQSIGEKQTGRSWSRFLDLLEYKGELYGTHVVRVNARGTTKKCNQCCVETSKPLWMREHSCPACGHTEDRDLNAAKNILDRGLNKLSLHVGPGRSESTPVQTVLPAFVRHSGRVDAKHVVEAGMLLGTQSLTWFLTVKRHR